MVDITGKNVIITGGSRGIGAAISALLAEHGAIIHVVYRRDAASANATLAALRGAGHLATAVDISDAKALQSFFEAVDHPIDILINNAGVAFHHPILDVDYDEWLRSWDQIFDLNIRAIANSCYCAAQIMKQQGFGRIISISSRGAYRGEPLMPAYGASKAALNSMTQSLAYALAPHNIFVGAIAPGFVETDMSRPRLEGEVGERIKAQSPLNRVAQPEEIAQAVYAMIQAPIWTTGSIVNANGASYFR